MKRYGKITDAVLCFVLSAVMILLSAGASYGGEPDYDIDDSHYDDSGQKVYDYAELFDDGEEAHIQSAIVRAAKKVKLDIIIVTIDDNDGKSAKQYAADFYDDNGFGYDCDCGSGVLMLVDMSSRDVAISTAGMARIYLDRETEAMLDEIAPCLTDGEYMAAAEAFVDYVESKGEEALGDSDYEEAYEAWYSFKHSDVKSQDEFYEQYADAGADTIFTIFRNPLISVLVAAAVAGMAVAVMSVSAKTQVTAGSRTYMDENGLKLSVRRDMFTHTTTTRRRIETNNNSGGGSSGSTRSSSGHSHGGGSRHF